MVGMQAASKHSKERPCGRAAGTSSGLLHRCRAGAAGTQPARWQWQRCRHASPCHGAMAHAVPSAPPAAAAPAAPASAAGTAAATRGRWTAPHRLQAQPPGHVSEGRRATSQSSGAHSKARKAAQGCAGAAPAAAAGCAGVAKPLVSCSVCVSTRALAGACEAVGSTRVGHERAAQAAARWEAAGGQGGLWAPGAASRLQDRARTRQWGHAPARRGPHPALLRPSRVRGAPTLARGAGPGQHRPRNCLTSLLEAVRRLFASIFGSERATQRRLVC